MKDDKSYTRFNVWHIPHWTDTMPGTLELRAWDGYKYRPLGKAVRLVKRGNAAEVSLTLNGGVPIFRLDRLPGLHQLHEDRGCLPPRFVGFFVGVRIPKEGCN